MWFPQSLRSLKPPLKRFRNRVRSRYLNRFYSFTPADLSQKLRDLGVKTGDVLCVHSSFDQFLGFQGSFGDAIHALQDSVGHEGGILMPTQPFTATAVDYVRTHPITDLARAPSLMGLMTEILRRTPDAIRSIHPTHPVAAWGNKGRRLLGNDWEARTPCGYGTAYHRLLEYEGSVLMLGTGVQVMTFYHCIEELIEPLMPFSPFTSQEYSLQTRDLRGSLYCSRMRLFEPAVSARRRMNVLVPELKRRNSWREGKIGRLDIVLLPATAVLEACVSMAKRGQFCYLSDRA
ncbi:MAG: hypothetical protein DMG16_25665 [Acidobacteria bacterium]|nr:MAG: hypothetical protein DMG16_25665 [Acidobacteriota bacterium]